MYIFLFGFCSGNCMAGCLYLYYYLFGSTRRGIYIITGPFGYDLFFSATHWTIAYIFYHEYIFLPFLSFHVPMSRAMLCSLSRKVQVLQLFFSTSSAAHIRASLVGRLHYVA